MNAPVGESVAADIGSPQNPRLRFLRNLEFLPKAAVTHDLNHPDFNPPDCPDWAKETLPNFIIRYRGRNGQPHPYNERPFPLAMTVRGVDRYQANQFIVFRPETEDFLYRNYTPLNVRYRTGSLPAFEKAALEVTRHDQSDIEKAMAFLQRGASRMKHPDAVPCGQWVEPDRNLDEEALLASECGWCNEQARIFIRLCQVCNIPARLIHLFYSDEKSGHTVAEFYADGHWCMADATWLCVFPDETGRLLSAAECHDGGPGQRLCGISYAKRWKELLALSDQDTNLKTPEITREWRTRIGSETADSLAAKQYYFAIINHPLPKEPL